MAEVSRADVLNYLEKANMLEVSELIGEIEEKFGVTAATPVAAVAAPAGGSEALPERLKILLKVHLSQLKKVSRKQRRKKSKLSLKKLVLL